MREIYFITSNKGKVASLNRLLKSTRHTVVQKDIEIPEIQADTALEVATHKATFAYESIGSPVIVQDSAFHINALSGFPGPYIKYINGTIGIEGILRLMKDINDRTAYFEQALVYTDQAGKAHPFTSTEEAGTIAQMAYKGSYEYSWSELWRIYIPAWSTKTLSELALEGQPWSNKASEITQFVKWIERQK